MQLEPVTRPNYEERINRMKEIIVNQPHEICIERAVLITEFYRNTKGVNPKIRFAKAMEHILKNMTIKIWDDEFIVGNRCSKLVGTPLYPEVRVDTLESDIDLYERRAVQKFLLSEEDKKIILEKIIPYWKNEDKTLQERFYSYLNDDLKEKMLELVYIVDTNMTNGVGHFFPGHPNVFKFGFDGLIKKAEKKLEEFKNDEDKAAFLRSVIIVLNAAKEFIRRYANLAKEMSENETDTIRKSELIEISEICKNISGKPPNSFKEALQLLFFTHIISGIEDGGFAISIGRLDQLLYPYYLKDINDGKITENEVLFLIKCFYLKLTTLWNYVLNKGIIAAEGPPIAENLTIGGLKRDGTDATNELSFLILKAYKELQTVQPIFSVRIHSKTPDELIIKTGEALKAGASIALFNDDVMIPGLIKLGYSLEDAREYAPIGCVEPAHPCKTFGCTNATQINIVKILELTLNNGIDMFKRKKYGLANSKLIQSYEDLWEEFIKQFRFFLNLMVETMMHLERAIAEINPQPFLSATTDNCIEKGLDITSGGAIYDFTTTQMIGFATLVDSLAVIKKVVFEDKLLNFEELISMLKKNYRGKYRDKSGEEWRQIFINKIPKWGNDIDYVDSIGRDVVKMFCEEILKFKNFRGGRYNPGIYSTSFHLAFGAFTAATADGRKSRESLSNGLGPTHGYDKNGPTAILNSVKKLENELQTNGNSLILSFHPKTLRKDLFLPLIQSFFGENGGYHIQFNVIGRETLCDAQKHPEKYPGLVVRIAGYSVLFNELSKLAQDDIIKRTEY
ncbi:MAG: glycyl radical protein [Promethearchaeota archaeon]